MQHHLRQSLVKLPFPLTPRFKSMFQRGIESLDGLDETYISSLSWYFVVLFGLMGVNSLIMDGEGGIAVEFAAALIPLQRTLLP